MNKTFLIFLCISLLGIAVSKASIDTDETKLSLNGTWSFTIDETAENWDKIEVPGNWDTLAEYSTHKGKGWYKRDFEIPQEWKGKHLRLRFEAVYHDATVWVNGVELGSHNGGYTPFEFDISNVAVFEGKNTVTVCADNSYGRGAWWHWGGISRDVNLYADEDVRLLTQHIRSEPNLKTGEAKLFVTYEITNSGETERKVLIKSKGEGFELSGESTVAAGSVIVLKLKTALSADQVKLWHFDHPNLYELNTIVSMDGADVQEKSDRFGIRKVEFKGDGLYLNGERVRLNGFNRVSDSLEHGNTEPDELVKKDVDLMKEANGNLTRLMHHPQAPNLLDYLDEKGMLIWCEIPVWGGDKNLDPQVKSDLELTKQWMSEMIERDYNHPCIIGWSVGNEITDHWDYVANMMHYTRTLDSYRNVCYASYTGARWNYGQDNDPITFNDVILYNTYPYNSHAAKTVNEKWPNKPMFFSEFGRGQLGIGEDAYSADLEQMYRFATVGRPHVIGISLWTFNDYRSDYKGTPESGNREWGIVDVERNKKGAYHQVRKLFAPVTSLNILNDGIIELVPRMMDDVPSFTLRGYKLEWEGGSIDLPDIEPGSPVWRSPKELKLPLDAKISLVTPTGYKVADTMMFEKESDARYIDLNEWDLVWNDEFDGSNEDLDENWEFQNGPSGHILCSRWRENADVKDGILYLTNKKEQRGGQDWTSASMWTKEKFKYGYFEARYRYADGDTTNNSFWLMTRGEVPENKKRFEIDINEGNYPNILSTNIHNWTDKVEKDGKMVSQRNPRKFNMGDHQPTKEFHTYGLEWTEHELIFYFDGKEIRRERNYFCKSETPIWLSLALLKWYGNLTDAVDGTSMKVDYVRYYQRK